MKKRFKNNKLNIIKKLFIVFVFVFIITFAFLSFNHGIYNKIIQKDNSLVVSVLLKDNTNSFDVNNLKILKDPIFLFKYEFNQNILSKVTNTFEEVKKEPLVYIYNSHQTENYSTNSLESFNIIPTVLTADYILKEYLKYNDIESIIEEESISNILKQNNWKYGYSYRSSRILLENAIIKYNSLNYFLDIHRDSSVYEKTILEYENKKYARLLFVIGLENKNYEKNLALAESLNNKLEHKIHNITRGITKKSGPGVNGVYNQDFNENCILIEVGGQYNSIEEVNNTLKILADVIKEYIKEQDGKNT